MKYGVRVWAEQGMCNVLARQGKDTLDLLGRAEQQDSLITRCSRTGQSFVEDRDRVSWF